MITQLVMGALANIFAWVLNLIPAVHLPAWATAPVQYVAQAVPVITGLHNWLPVTAIAVAAGWVLTLWLSVVAIRIARLALSLFTGGGGNVAN